MSETRSLMMLNAGMPWGVMLLYAAASDMPKMVTSLALGTGSAAYDSEVGEDETTGNVGPATIGGCHMVVVYS